MTSKSYLSALNRLLEPLGFERQGKDWLRRTEGFVDCVNLQVNSFAGVTANISTKDLTSEAILKEAIPPGSPGLMYPVTVRIGFLIDGNDRWWRRDPKGPAELAGAVEAYALPFIEGLRPLQAQALRFGRLGKGWGPAPQHLYLAITLYRMGERQEACERLMNPPRRLPPEWVIQVEGLRRRLGCEARELAAG